MSDVHRLPDLKQAEHEASEWIARLDADDVSANDRARFEYWRNANPANQRAYEDLSQTWQQFTAAGPLVRAVAFAQSMNEAARLHRPVSRRWVAAAALLVVVALLGWLYMGTQTSGTAFETAVGEQISAALQDGSIIELNSNTEVRVNYSSRSRIIRLERGEAFFKVAHDIQKPFWVVAGRSWVRAVGTEFNVYRRPTVVRVTVREGTVKVGYADAFWGTAPSERTASGIAASVLTAGEQAELTGSLIIKREVSADELARFVSRREGSLYFENRPLGEVADELSRYTNIQLVVEDQKLRELPIGGTFQASPAGAQALLKMLEQGFGLSVRRDGNRAYISSHRSQDQVKQQ